LSHALGQALLLLASRRFSLGDPGARFQRFAGQVVAALFDGSFGAFLPLHGVCRQLLRAAFEVLLLSEQVRASHARLLAGVLHFPDQRPQQLFRILGFFDQGVDVGRYDIAKAGESAHVWTPVFETVFIALGMQHSCHFGKCR